MIEDVNRYPIDWCVNCALTATNPKDVKEMMFCYILINYLRVAPMNIYTFILVGKNLIFKLDLSQWENSTIGKLKRKLKYYRCLQPVLEEHLKNLDSSIVWSFNPYFEKDFLCIEIERN